MPELVSFAPWGRAQITTLRSPRVIIAGWSLECARVECGAAFVALPCQNSILSTKIMQDRSLAMLETSCAGIMRGFTLLHAVLYAHHKRSRWQLSQLIALLLMIPCFIASNFLFKRAYSLNQRRLLHLCGQDFFLKFYDRPVAGGDIVCILNSLRHIKHGLECAKTSEKFSNHYSLTKP